MDIIGLFGEAVPFDSGLVTLLKGHGNYNPDIVHRINYLEPTTLKEDLINQMRITDNKAILLIRNPYHVIYSYRNYVKKGDLIHAEHTYFYGAGKILSIIFFCFIIWLLSFKFVNTLMSLFIFN